MFGGTRDPRQATHLGGETRDLRAETLQVRPKTQDPGPNSQVAPETRDPGPKNDTQDLKSVILLLHGT